MKKIAISLLLIIAIVASFALFGCKPEEDLPDDTLAIASDHLYLDSKAYVNYAEVCDYDYEKYPDLLQQGLFWHTWNESNEKIVEAAADSETGASYVDPTKPTIIFIHGMETGGYKNRNSYDLPNYLNARTELGLEDDISAGTTVNLYYLWLRAGWNVGMFHWERFSGEPKQAVGGNPMENEERIWATDGKTGTRFVDAAGIAHYDATEYCQAEHFAAEYIRAMRLLPETMGDKEIRVYAHSMGGQVTTAGVFLLTELADPAVNQLPKKQLPDRYTMIDTYFSMVIDLGNGKSFDLTVNDINISWSKKPLPHNGMKDTILHCLNVLHENGVALDYYSYYESTLRLGLTAENMQDILKISTFTDLNIDWASYYPSGGLDAFGWRLGNGHVALLYYLGTSIATVDMCQDVTNGSEAGEFAPTALMSNDQLKLLAGKYYLINGGQTTFTMADDTFIQPDLQTFLTNFPTPPEA